MSTGLYDTTESDGLSREKVANIPPQKNSTAQDLLRTVPPTFKDRMKTFFFNKGLGSRPDYLQDVYKTVPRTIYVNSVLPDSLKDEHGLPIITYPRNKIRTTKYTPLSFLPKNLAFQFKNVANTYFLILVILGAIQIFGVSSPGLAAVPLIVIVCLTAIKDGFEDYSRAKSDSELNNSPVHLLQGLVNPNLLENDVSSWRRFKKKSTRVVDKSFAGIAKFFIFVFASKSQKQVYKQRSEMEDTALRRVSTIISERSNLSAEPRKSFASRLRHERQSADGRTSGDLRVSTDRRFNTSAATPNTLINPNLLRENETNTSKVAFKFRHWKDIHVGDIIRVSANEEVPADVIILSSSDAENSCYIETKNLDGETNLKSKSTIQAGGSSNLKHSRDFLNTKFWVECDAPNPSLYTFRGTLHYENYDKQGNLVNPDEKEPVTNNNVLLRGCTLRNTKWVIGLVIYTGDETKIMLNSGITPTKRSLISRQINLSVIINFALLFILCFVSALVNGLFYNKKNVSRLYFEFEPYASTSAANAVILFFVALIIYQALVPISLYISIEIIKTLQAFFIFSDTKMFYEKLNFPCTPKAWNISDDLGQIEYVFSDKTGTLTQNVMEFKKCTINGKSYGLAYTEAKQGVDKRQGLDIVSEGEKWKKIITHEKEEMLQNLTSRVTNDQLRDENLTFISNDYVIDTIITEESAQKEANEEFMLALALCHTVVTEPNVDEPTLNDFKAESPDESALVSVARDLGIVFENRVRKNLTLSFYGEQLQYELVETIAFTSTRKRMSCIVRTPANKYLLICKGADNVIFSRLDQSKNTEEVISKTALHLEDYANEGLRTLCIAQKELDADYYYEWSQRYAEVKASIEDSRDDLIDALDDEIERDLVLLGGTAIEDKLQSGVPDSIAILAQAGIKLWVLTGDRIETAINIGFSCNLLGNEMKLLVVRPEDDNIENLHGPKNLQYIDDLITKYLHEEFQTSTESEEDVDKLIFDAKKDHSTPTTQHALIIDGNALLIIFDSEHSTLKQKFLLLGKQCKSVICCRVSPAQKALVVKLVKETLNVMTLAIGDGANDVAMIQAANVGVGIAGEEGRQAVMSSDYAIGQFRFLTRLLLVHGRWSYKRLAEMIPCFFYKNVVFTLTCVFYGIYNNFDGSYLYEYTFLMFYNLAFTSLTVIFLAVLDQDVSDTVSLLVPELYRSGILGLEWSQYKFAWYMADGCYQSVICFFFPYLMFRIGFQNPDGLIIDHRFWIGTLVIMIAVTACNLYILLRQYRWDWLSLVIYAVSILLVFFWAGAWSALPWVGEYFGAGAQVMGTLAVWCCFFIGVVVCLLPRFTYDFLKTNFNPSDIDIIREKVRHGDYDSYPNGYDPTNFEDVERYRLLNHIIENEPSLLEKLEHQAEAQDEHHHKITRTFQSLKRKTTSLRKNTIKSRKATINEQFRHPINIDDLRQQMVHDGDYNTAGPNLARINTTHELPGLTQAGTLMSYHTRNSFSLAR